ncbi:MAG: serine/threonine-protein kinase [Polyangia bacterium]
MNDPPVPSKVSKPPPSLGRPRLGRYDVIYPLAQGGMASVHVGRLSGMAGFERLVAIKVIHPHLSSEQDFVKMFLDEARLAARIHHPNVGEVIEVGQEGDLYYMVCELIVGQSLRNIYRRSRAFGIEVPHPLWADIAAKVCQGLHDAHELRNADGEPLNLVHRDVSPRNVLVSYNGFVKLIDFGIAWAQERVSHTDAGSLKGKIGFMPPEQIRGESLDRRADLFSLGVCLYMLTTGSHPFPGKSDAERLNKILNGDLRRPREMCRSMDPALEKIILTALDGDKENRYETASAMGRELMAHVYSSADPPGSWDSSTEISALMHRCFEHDLVQHRERIRSAVERVEEIDPDELERVLDSRPPGAAAQHTNMTVAETPRSIKTRAGGGWKKLVGALAAGAVAVTAAAVILTVFLAGGGGEKQPDAGTSRVAAGQPDKGSALGATSSTAPAASTEEDADARLPARIEIEVTPSHATLELDGVELAADTTEILVPRSGDRHTLTATAEGFESTTHEFAASEDGRLKIALEPIEKKSPPKTGKRHPAGKKKRSGKKRPAGKKKSAKNKKGPGLVDSPYSGG